MNTVYLFRSQSTDQGTAGVIFCPETKFMCKSIELPWLDNKQSISCIPPGEYITAVWYSKKFGKTFVVQGVPGRSAILFHSGIWAGNTAKGFKTHSAGCILLGQKHGIYGGQLAVLNSRITVSQFKEDMEYKPFKLIIV